MEILTLTFHSVGWYYVHKNVNSVRHTIKTNLSDYYKRIHMSTYIKRNKSQMEMAQTKLPGDSILIILNLPFSNKRISDSPKELISYKKYS